MKFLPPHYSQLPFCDSSSVCLYLTHSCPISLPPSGHFSVHHVILCALRSSCTHLKYERPFDSFCKQTDFICFPFHFMLLPHLRPSLFSLFYAQVRTQTHIQNVRLNRVFHLRADRRRAESEWPVSTAGVLLLDLVAQSATVLLLYPPPPPCSWCPGVWAAVYLPLAVSLCGFCL